MAKTLKQILGGKNLTGVVQGVKGGIPNVLPAEFFNLTRPVEGDQATYRKVNGTRKTARLAMYGAPSRIREHVGITEVPVKLIHSVESQGHNPIVLQNLTNLGDEGKQAMGRGEIARQTGEFARLFTNLRVAAVTQMLALGLNHFDGDGNLLPSASGAVFSVDFQVPAGNKDGLDVFGAGNLISASWATAGTDIIGDVKAIKTAALKLTGYPLVHAFYGENVLEHLASNTAIAALTASNNPMQNAFAAHEVPENLLGLQWHPADTAFYEDQDGVIKDIWGADTVVFTPAIDRTWYEMFEGSYVIPTDIGDITGDAVAALSNVTTVNGMFSYAQVTSDPVGIKHVAGDTFLPCLKVPGAIFIGDTTP